jgi:transposase
VTGNGQHSEQLEYVRAHFRVILHRRPRLACSCCDCIVQAAAPSRPIERGLSGPGLLAHIVASKFDLADGGFFRVTFGPIVKAAFWDPS